MNKPFELANASAAMTPALKHHIEDTIKGLTITYKHTPGHKVEKQKAGVRKHHHETKEEHLTHPLHSIHKQNSPLVVAETVEARHIQIIARHKKLKEEMSSIETNFTNSVSALHQSTMSQLKSVQNQIEPTKQELHKTDQQLNIKKEEPHPGILKTVVNGLVDIAESVASSILSGSENKKVNEASKSNPPPSSTDFQQSHRS